MCALTTSSDEIRPVLMAFANHVAEAPITFFLRLRFLAISDHVAGFDVEHLHPRADQLLEG